MTPDQEKEFTTRIEGFKPKFEALLKEYEVELVVGPLYAPGPGGAFFTVVQTNIGDTKYKGVPSPITEEELWEK
jgi:hypothetical protein